MATIESAVRSMLTQGTTLSSVGIPDSRIAHGYRLQDSILPALTYELDQDERLSIGSPALARVQVEIRVIAERTEAALAVLDDVQAVCVPGTYDTVPFSAVQWLGHTIEPANTADGDENTPAELVCMADIYYTEP